MRKKVAYIFMIAGAFGLLVNLYSPYSQTKLAFIFSGTEDTVYYVINLKAGDILVIENKSVDVYINSTADVKYVASSDCTIEIKLVSREVPTLEIVYITVIYGYNPTLPLSFLPLLGVISCFIIWSHKFPVTLLTPREKVSIVGTMCGPAAVVLYPLTNDIWIGSMLVFTFALSIPFTMLVHPRNRIIVRAYLLSEYIFLEIWYQIEAHIIRQLALNNILSLRGSAAEGVIDFLYMLTPSVTCMSLMLIGALLYLERRTPIMEDGIQELNIAIKKGLVEHVFDFLRRKSDSSARVLKAILDSYVERGEVLFTLNSLISITPYLSKRDYESINWNLLKKTGIVDVKEGRIRIMLLNINDPLVRKFVRAYTKMKKKNISPG